MFEILDIFKVLLDIRSSLYFQPPTTITNSKKIATRNGHTNHNSDPYTDLGIEKDIGKEKDIDTHTKAKAQIDNTNNLLLLAKKINQSIKKNIVENIQ